MNTTQTLALDHDGQHLTGDAETIARAILAANGEPEPHPALLADTMREVEYHAQPAENAEPVYEVVRQEYDMPCEHPACDLMHRHLYNASYDAPRLVDVYDMTGTRVVETRWETRYHMKQRVEWVILRNGVRVGNAHDTKREALAEAATKPTI